MKQQTPTPTSPPTPQKGRSRAKEERRYFPIFDFGEGGGGGVKFLFIYCRFKVFVRSRSNLHVQVLCLRRGEIGAPAEKLFKAMTKNTNKRKTHMVLTLGLEHEQQWGEARAFNVVLTLPSYNILLQVTNYTFSNAKGSVKNYLKCLLCLVGQQSSPTGSEARNSGYHGNWNLGNERQ